VFGWGVRAEESWPERLEQGLAGVEVANLGEPGASPFQYANLVDRTVPLLKPDVVVVGISESNDLDQSTPQETPTVFRSFLRRPLVYLLPNLSDMLYQRRHPSEYKPLHPVWVQQAGFVLSTVTPEEMAHFGRLAPDVQDYYRKGLINPSELAEVLRQPGHVHSFNVQDPAVQGQIGIMAHQLERIRKRCEAYGAQLLVVGIPAAVCVNRPAFEGQRKAGFQLSDQLLAFDGYDQAAAQAAAAARVPFVSAQREFRAQQDTAGLYFSLDNHLAPAGDKLLAQVVQPQVEVLLKR
jgi:hypothetical protein